MITEFLFLLYIVAEKRGTGKIKESKKEDWYNIPSKGAAENHG